MGLMFAPAASRAAQLDTVTAMGAGVGDGPSQLSNIDISAQSEPSGQNVSGARVVYRHLPARSALPCFRFERRCFPRPPMTTRSSDSPSSKVAAPTPKPGRSPFTKPQSPLLQRQRKGSSRCGATAAFTRKPGLDLAGPAETPASSPLWPPIPTKTDHRFATKPSPGSSRTCLRPGDRPSLRWATWRVLSPVFRDAEWIPPCGPAAHRAQTDTWRNDGDPSAPRPTPTRLATRPASRHRARARAALGGRANDAVPSRQPPSTAASAPRPGPIACDDDVLIADSGAREKRAESPECLGGRLPAVPVRVDSSRVRARPSSSKEWPGERPSPEPYQGMVSPS